MDVVEGRGRGHITGVPSMSLRSLRPLRRVVLALLPAAAAWLPGAPETPVACVIHVSVDGLRPDAVAALGAAGAPTFHRLKTEGATSDNARSDYDYTITLPNHTCQLTGRPVTGTPGHGWTSNSDPLPGQTLETNKGSYVAGVFDVVHDAGRRTGMFVSKSKFSLYPASWGPTTGAPDITGPDNGRNKIDVYRNIGDTTTLVNELLIQEAAQPLAYAFLHLADPDNAGHSCGWDPAVGSCYSNAVKQVDTLLGTVLAFVSADPRFQGRTLVIVTADHGGTGTNHSTATLAVNYTIPFYVWGAGTTGGADLYALNPQSRKAPGTSRPTYAATPQPVRNGDAANLAARALGVASVPGSSIGASADLANALPVPADLSVALVGSSVTARFSSRLGFRYDVQGTDLMQPATWTTLASNLAGTGAILTHSETVSSGTSRRFYRVLVHP